MFGCWGRGEGGNRMIKMQATPPAWRGASGWETREGFLGKVALGLGWGGAGRLADRGQLLLCRGTAFAFGGGAPVLPLQAVKPSHQGPCPHLLSC